MISSRDSGNDIAVFGHQAWLAASGWKLECGVAGRNHCTEMKRYDVRNSEWTVSKIVVSNSEIELNTRKPLSAKTLPHE